MPLPADPHQQWALGDRLRRRFQRLPREWRQEILERDTFTEVLIEALSEVTGRTIHAVHGGGGGLAGRPQDRAAAFLLGEDQYATVHYDETAEQRWPLLDPDMSNPHQSQRRSTYLHVMLRSARPGWTPVSALLAGVNDAEGLRIQRVDGRVALALHWQASIEAGQTPEAIRLMLGLTLSPASLSHVRFPKDGPPQVVAD